MGKKKECVIHGIGKEYNGFFYVDKRTTDVESIHYTFVHSTQKGSLSISRKLFESITIATKYKKKLSEHVKVINWKVETIGNYIRATFKV